MFREPDDPSDESPAEQPAPGARSMRERVFEHRSGHRTEYFWKDGEPWIRDLLDGHVLEISERDFRDMPISAYIRHMESDQSRL